MITAVPTVLCDGDVTCPECHQGYVLDSDETMGDNIVIECLSCGKSIHIIGWIVWKFEAHLEEEGE